MNRILIEGATIVNEGREQTGSVLIVNDKIEHIYLGSSHPEVEADETIDAQGMLLMPGVIDDHVHFRDPGLTHKADMESESRAAAAGGVTTVFDMPNTKPQTTTLEALDDKFVHAAETCHVNYSFFFGATNDNTELLREIDTRHACGVKLFMGSSTGNMLVDQAESLRKVFESSPTIIMTHCEDSGIIDANTAKVRAEYGDDAPIGLHPQIRSQEACLKSTTLAVELAKQTGARLHIAHITTAAELNLLSALPIDKKSITAEVCPAHLIFCDADYSSLGARIKCNPAVKSKENRDALRKALREGIIDVVGTDHAPHTLEEKQGGCLKATSGMPMIQFSLVSMMQLAEEGVLNVTDVVEKMCHAPAQLFDIDKRGFIREGYYADLVLIEKAPWTLTANMIESKCGWSPLEGTEFVWKVSRTLCNGQWVYENGKVDRSIIGKAVEFNR